MADMTLPIEPLPHGADLPLPAHASAGAADLELRAAVAVDLLPGRQAAAPTGMRVALPPAVEGQVRPRSGLGDRQGVTVLNAPGRIDGGDRGEIRVILVKHGLAPVLRAEPRAAALDATATARGDGGFGSTGRTADPSSGSPRC